MDDDEDEGIPVEINNDLERRIADVFEMFDVGGNKRVDVREIGTVVRALGCCPTLAELQEILVAIEDPQIPDTVHLSKFLPHMVQVVKEHKYQPATPDQLLEAFHALDPEKRGYLTKDEICTLMTQTGEPFNEDELEEMLEIAIDPHTQTVPYEYYINQLMHDPEGDDNIYKLSDRLIAENPPPPPPKRFSQMFAQLASNV